MPVTLLVKGKLEATGYGDDQKTLDTYVPIDYIMDWFQARLPGTKNPASLMDRIMVLQSSTGSGKSTVLPPEFYHRFYNELRRNIACTQPRVLTATEIPNSILPYHTRAALDKQGYRDRTPLVMGENIGFKTGFVSKAPARGIVFMTIQVLVQQLNFMSREDFMKTYCLIIIDEAHDRSINNDSLLYGMKKFLVNNWQNPECPFLVVTSATMDPFRYADYLFAGSGLDKKDYYRNVIRVQGFSFPIQEHFLPYDSDNYIQTVADLVAQIHQENQSDFLISEKDKKGKLPEDYPKTTGFRDIMVFVAGGSEIKKIKRKVDVLNAENPFFMQYPVLPIELSGDVVKVQSEEYRHVFANIDDLEVEVEVRKPEAKEPARESKASEPNGEQKGEQKENESEDEEEASPPAGEPENKKGGGKKPRRAKKSRRVEDERERRGAARSDERVEDERERELHLTYTSKLELDIGGPRTKESGHKHATKRREESETEAKSERATKQRGATSEPKASEKASEDELRQVAEQLLREKQEEEIRKSREEDERRMQGGGGFPAKKRDVPTIKKKPVRRVIVGTNVAETGITIETLGYVIDTGGFKSNEFNPCFGVQALITKPVTRAMYKQRRGRVGRKAPGKSYTTYTKATMDGMMEDQYPDILKNDVAGDLLGFILRELDPSNVASEGTLLQLVRNESFFSELREKQLNVLKLDLMDLPPTDSLQYCLEKLYVLGAIDSNSLVTPLGFIMSKFRFISLESMKMILSGFAWGAPIIDLVTIAAFLAAPEDLIPEMMKKRYEEAMQKGMFTLFPNIPSEITDYARIKTALLLADDFLKYVVMFVQLQRKVQEYSFAVTEAEVRSKKAEHTHSIYKWASSVGIDPMGMVGILERRDDLINNMCLMGFNPYSNTEHSLYYLMDSYDAGEIINYVKLMKQCIYEGYKLNLAVWNPQEKRYYGRRSHLPLNISHELIYNSWQIEKLGDINPRYLLYDKVGYMPKPLSNIYEAKIENISILDGFIEVDVDFA